MSVRMSVLIYARRCKHMSAVNCARPWIYRLIETGLGLMQVEISPSNTHRLKRQTKNPQLQT